MPKARSWLVAVAFAVLTLAPIYAASADQPDAVVAELRKQLAALEARIAELEARSAMPAVGRVIAAVSPTSPTPAPLSPASAPPSTGDDRYTFKGDLRYRHEAFDVENRREQHRQRVRARASVSAVVNNAVTAVVGLATGSDDPTSTNQTLGEGASSKGVVLDLAYVNWATPVDGLNVHAGKIKNPILRPGGSALIWDGDLRPEGFGVTYSADRFFLNGVGSWLDEASGDDDSYLIGIQSGFRTTLSDAALTTGLGYYNFLDARGELPFYDGSALGNRLAPDGTYLSGFELVEAFAELRTGLGSGEIVVFADYVTNLAARHSAYDTGYSFGAAYAVDQWSAGYTWRDVEADAVLGTWTDSDFIGGGTDGRGHILQASYSLARHIELTGTLFLNERDIDFGVEETFKRLMLDISFKH